MAHVSWDLYLNAPYRKCNAVPNALMSKFTTLKKPYIWSWFVFHASNYVCLQIMYYGKIVLRS